MTCPEVVDGVTAYLDGALSPAGAARFAEHLDTCADCRVHVAQFARAVSAVGDLPADELDDATLAVLLDAFRRRVGRR
jgi:anti-sigma factor RsiW